MPVVKIGLAVALMALAGQPSTAAEGTGLPLPRFVSLHAGQANLRTGPGLQYPVEWVYQRRHLPLEIVAEHRTWRKIRDWQGTQGWLHQNMLDGSRTIIINGSVRTLRQSADADADSLARVEPGVVGKLINCPDGSSWCQVEVEGFKGWLRKVEFWGVYPTEVVR